MNIIFLLIPLSLVLLGVAIAAFFWAMKHDQFDDLEGPAYSIFNEDDPKPRQRGQKNSEGKQGDEQQKLNAEPAQSGDRTTPTSSADSATQNPPLR